MLFVLSSLTVLTVITISCSSSTPPTSEPFITSSCPAAYPAPASTIVTSYFLPILDTLNVAATGVTSIVSPVPAAPATLLYVSCVSPYTISFHDCVIGSVMLVVENPGSEKIGLGSNLYVLSVNNCSWIGVPGIMWSQPG